MASGDTGGRKSVTIFATPGWRITSVCYSRQYELRGGNLTVLCERTPSGRCGSPGDRVRSRRGRRGTDTSTDLWIPHCSRTSSAGNKRSRPPYGSRRSRETCFRSAARYSSTASCGPTGPWFGHAPAMGVALRQQWRRWVAMRPVVSGSPQRRQRRVIVGLGGRACYSYRAFCPAGPTSGV